jgi:hypothetical protein
LRIEIVGVVAVFKWKSIKARRMRKGKVSKPPSSFLFLLGSMVSILSAAVRYGDWNWKIQGALLFDEISGRTK